MIFKDRQQVSVLSQAKASLYSVLEHEENEYITLPIDPNSLEYKGKSLVQKYRKAMYSHKEKTDSLNNEFKANLLTFYVFLTVLVGVVFINEISIFLGGKNNTNQIFLVSTMGIVILLSAFFLLWLIISKTSARFKNRIWFTGLGIELSLFLIFCDERVLSGIFGYSYNEDGLQYGFFILIIIYMVNLVLIESSFCLWIILIFHTTIKIFTISLLQKISLSSIFLETILVLVVGWVVIGEAQITEYRSKQLFYRRSKEEEKMLLYMVKENEINNESNSFIEELINSCLNIEINLKQVNKLILFKETRNIIKDAVRSLSLIIHKIAHSMHSDHGYSTLHMADEDEAQFLHEYMNLQSNLTSTNQKIQKKPSAKLQSVIQEKELFSDIQTPELNSMISEAGTNWNFDIWFIYDLTGQSISTLTGYLYNKWRFGDLLLIDRYVFENYFEAVEEEYVQNPYHNACHAADVLHSTIYYIKKSFLIDEIEPHEMLAVVVGAIGHDLAHPGVTNRFLQNSRADLAITYNDASILENMHCAMTFRIASERENNIFLTFSNEEFAEIRKLVIEMILETDLSKHFEIIGRFRTRAVNLNDLVYENLEDKSIILSMALKVSDVSHAAKTRDEHLKWTSLITEEFFLEGDLEKERNLPVSMFCDRERSNLAKSENGFLKNICLPMFELWCLFLNSKEVDENCLENVRENLDMWSMKMERKLVNTVVEHVDPNVQEGMFYKHLHSAF